MKKFALALSVILSVVVLQAKGMTAAFENKEIVKIKLKIEACSHNTDKEQFSACMARTLVPVVNKYVDLVRVNPKEAKRVGRELADIRWDNNGTAYPTNVNMTLSTFLSYQMNLERMNRAFYGASYPLAEGAKAGLNLPWYNFAIHLTCAKDSSDYLCYKGLPTLKKIEAPSKR